MPSDELARLRALLADAATAAEQVGDDAYPEPAGAGYFADAATSGIEEAIAAISKYEGEITMFVGAGVSMEAELPSWNALVRKLLIEARKGEDGALLEAWAETVLQEGPLAAAAVAEALIATKRYSVAPCGMRCMSGLRAPMCRVPWRARLRG